MTEQREHRPAPAGDENVGVNEDVEGQGGEGARNAEATPPIGQDAQPGQTATPAPEDDVGVPPDEEMDRDEVSDDE